MIYAITITLILFVLILVVLFARYSRRIKNSSIHPAEIQSKLPLHDWNDAWLESMQSKTDPIADEVAAKIYQLHSIDSANALIASMSRNDEIDRNLPDFILKYFDEGAALPPWANKTLIEEGEIFYMSHGMKISTLLFLKALPECYCIAKGAEVLYTTGRMTAPNGEFESLSRRIAETAQFTVNVMQPGGLTWLGTGIRTAQKVRLVHAMIRYMIKKKGWDTIKFGEPINQEDLAFTLTTFSSSVIDGLQLAGVIVKKQEAESYIHCFRIIGYYMGIQEDLLFNNLQDARALHQKVLKRKMASSTAGTALINALVQFMEILSPSGKLNDIIPQLVRHYCGNAIADCLELPAKIELTDKHLHHDLVMLIRKADRITDTPVIEQLVMVIDHVIITAAAYFLNSRQRIAFKIPDQLRDNWNIPKEKPENL